MTGGVRFVEVGNDRRVIRHSIDQVGNNLTATLRWCSTHVEPVWVYGDDSFECPHAAIVGWSPDGHDLIDAPWEDFEPPDPCPWTMTLADLSTMRCTLPAAHQGREHQWVPST